MHIYKYLFIYARLWVQPLFLVLIVRAASFFMHKNIGVIILHGHMCVSAFTCAHKIMHAHTNTYTYMQIQQVRAHACVHCKTLQNFAMHSKISPWWNHVVHIVSHCVTLMHPSMPTSIHYIACITFSKIIQSTEPNITIHVSTTHCSPLHECISLSPLGRSVCSRPMKMPPAALQCKPIACNCLKILAYLWCGDVGVQTSAEKGQKG